MIQLIEDWLVNNGMSQVYAEIIIRFGLMVLLLILSYLANFISKRILLSILRKIVERTRFTWDDVLLENKVFHKLSHLPPAVILYVLAPYAFNGIPILISFVELMSLMYLLITCILIINALLNSIHDIYQTYEISRQKPIKAYLQIVKIIMYFLGVVLIISLLINKSPWYFLSGLGAITAVIMLIFKDAILGFVAGIHLTTNNMVQHGDWIQMPKYGADGDVIDISLTTVKVQNWDKTISTIPTYSLITDSFKNWRGMSESGGRRIKRAINIDMNTIKFCSVELLEKFSKIHLLTNYISRKTEELKNDNAEQNIDASVTVNERHLTNIGTFRAYVIEYLKNHPQIHRNMTFLVRQLTPTEHGLPLEIYVFSKDQRWVQYEAIQADIFDHLLAVVPEFELRVFQSPSGYDFGSALTHIHS